MTQKETLLAKRYELNNELMALRGQTPLNLDGLTETILFREQAKDERLYSLNRDIEMLKESIKTQKAKNEKQAKIDAYYQTEEGKARKQYLEGLLQKESDAFDKAEADNLDNLKEWIKDFLGDHWTVRRAREGRVEFKIWDADKSDYVFGSDIEITYEERDYFWEDREKFETNIGAMGSFDVLSEDTASRARFYMDLGKFLSDKTKLEELKRMMKAYERSLSEIRSHIGFINHELENPLSLV